MKILPSTPHVMVFGTRTFNDYPLMQRKLDAFTADIRPVVVVTGEWRGIGKGTPAYIGADLLAEQWASSYKFPYRRFEPPFEEHPKGSPAPFHIRNQEMVKFIAGCENGFAVGFWDGESPGSRSVIELLKKFKVQHKIVWLLR